MTRTPVAPRRLGRATQPASKQVVLSDEADRFARTLRAERSQNVEEKPPNALMAYIMKSEWMTKRGLHVIALACFVVITGWLSELSLNRSEVVAKQEVLKHDCLTLSSPAGAENPKRWTTDDKLLVLRDAIRNGAAAATRDCRPDDCPAKEFDTYKSAVGQYLRDRHMVLDFAYREAGQAGIDFMNDYYSKNYDYDIIYGGRDLLRAGRLQVAHLQPAQARYLQLLSKHSPEPVPLCFKSQP
jgi:hypothetical protein